MADNENTANDAAFEEMASNAAPAEATGDLEAKLTQLDGELRRANNEVLRAQAEFENFRKRMRREMEEETRYAALPLVSELLPVIDNLERAIQAASQTEGASGLVDGVKLVIMQFDQALAKNGCVKIEALGKEFDPHLHMAVMQEPSNEYPAGTISRELQSGYKMHDRVVRPSQVFVSSGPAAQ
jgi:molecular chaperone GrpE